MSVKMEKQLKNQMKNKSQIQKNSTTPQYWSSLEQRANDVNFQKKIENEFLSSPLAEAKDGGWARREFLKLMGASLAVTSLSCVRRPSEKIIPYAQRPEGLTPGLPNYYASFFQDGHELFSSVVTQREARPIKMEGNDLAKFLNGSGLSARAQASFLSLYDTNRLNGPKKNLLSQTRLAKDTVNVSWKILDENIKKHLSKGKVALLTPSLSSESLSRLVGEFKYRHGVRHYTWDVEDLSAWTKSQQISYNEKTLPIYHFDKAKVILSVGADFLGTYHQPTTYAKNWVQGRKKVRMKKDMSKLYMVEADMSLTGSNADYRITVAPEEYVPFMQEVLHELLVVQKRSAYSNWSELKKYLIKSRENYFFRLDSKKLTKLVNDLWKARRDSLVLTGGLSCQTGDEQTLHVLANILNSALGGEGRTVQKGGTRLPKGSYSSLSKLLFDIESGRIETLIVHGCNPVYAGSLAGLDVFAAFKKLKLLVSTSTIMDETASISHYVATDHHFLESWSEAKPFDHLHLLGQPLVEPLYKTRSFGDSLMIWTGKRGKWQNYLKNYFKFHVLKGNNFESQWQKALMKGFIKKNKSGFFSLRPLNKSSSLYALTLWKPSKLAQYSLSLKFSSSIKEGSLANLSWLQELPDPVTKVCWGNYVSVSYTLSQKLKLKEGQLLEITSTAVEKPVTLKLPVYIQPGQHSRVISAHLGYGRTAAGDVANGQGVNVYKMASFNSVPKFSALPVQLKVLSEIEPLANTQSHYNLHGREIIVKSALSDYQKGVSPYLHGNGNEVLSAWKSHQFKKKWSMIVDLSSCTGCSACVVACQAENNIPVVGKKYVLQGRQMHWMRLDRYYEGSVKDPDSVNVIPIMCQHCDTAPCETVCPVLATVHSDEGTNDMIYNRCVGTRYCANNCPYKVRRFNWFSYEKRESPLELALNPEVTVRSRGVMEKCSFCIHRIYADSWMSKNLSDEQKQRHHVPLKTACQQSCPTQAISFGNLKEDKVLQKQYDHKDAYSLLGGLVTKPAVRYLYRVMNNEIQTHHGSAASYKESGHEETSSANEENKGEH